MKNHGKVCIVLTCCRAPGSACRIPFWRGRSWSLLCVVLWDRSAPHVSHVAFFPMPQSCNKCSLCLVITGFLSAFASEYPVVPCPWQACIFYTIANFDRNSAAARFLFSPAGFHYRSLQSAQIRVLSLSLRNLCFFNLLWTPSARSQGPGRSPGVVCSALTSTRKLLSVMISVLEGSRTPWVLVMDHTG